MRLTYRILALFTLLVPGIAMACLNLTSTDLDGNRKSAHRKHSTDKFIEQLTHRQPKSVLFLGPGTLTGISVEGPTGRSFHSIFMCQENWGFC